MPEAITATAVVAGAGSGSRLGAGGPKALVEVAGRPLIAWSLEALAAAKTIEAVVIAAPPGHEHELTAIAGDESHVVAGGDSRSQSVANALVAVETELVVVHDAARPLAGAALFDATVEALAGDEGADGVVAAAPLADTLKRAADPGLEVVETIDRTGLWAIQTPQAFRTESLRRAMAVEPAVLEAATDDAILVEAAGGRVRLYPVTEPNPKVTTEADLRLAAALLEGRG